MNPTRSSGPAKQDGDQGAWLLHLLAAAGLGIAQPLYDVMSGHPEFAIAHRLDRLDLLALAALLSIGPGGSAWLLVRGLRLVSRQAGGWSQRLVIGVLLGSLPLALLSGRPAPLGVRFAVLAMAAFLLALAYARSTALRRLLSALALGAIVFPALFLWRVSPAGSRSQADGSATLSPLPAEAIAIPAPGDLPPLVFVVLDELPLASLLADYDTFDADRFPNFAAFAKRSHWFRNATTVSQSTSAAVPALLTGRYPRGKAPPTAEAHPSNLFAWLRGHYELNVFERMTSLCGAACEEAETEVPAAASQPPTRTERLGLALEDLAAVYLALRLPGLGPVVTEGWSGFWYSPVVEEPGTRNGESETDRRAWNQPPQRFARFLARLEEAPRETLHFIHLSLPHVPWQYLPDGRTYPRERHEVVPGLEGSGKWGDSEWGVTQGQQRHLLQLQYADLLLGRLVSTLERLSLFDPSLIVLTSDHGTSFQPGEQRRVLTPSNLADIAHVPLLVKMPGQVDGTTRDDNVESVDVVPTVALAVGADLSSSLDGVDLFAGGRSSATKTIYQSWFHGGAGERQEFPAARLLETARAIEVKNRRFPAPSLYTIGRDRHLIGRPVSELPRREAAGTATVPLAAKFERIDPKARTLPVHLLGQLALPDAVAEPQRLAVALDGVVRAVSETHGELPAERLAFSVMLDPADLSGGRNRLAIYQVSGQATLAPLVLVSE